jgi:MFS family permease
VWAPILLVFLRLCQGFGAGAEQAGATVLMAEYSPVKRRGFFAALPFIGIQAGTLLAAGVFAYLGTLPEDVLLGWAWRIPFLASIILILVALFIRLRLKESPTFVELEKQEQVADHLAGDLQPLRAACGAASACGWRRTAARTCSTRWPWRTRPAPSWSTSRSARPRSPSPR